MAAANKEWHQKHVMPDNPTPMEQIAWHEAHRKYCDCSPIPANVLKMMPPASEQD